MSHRTLYLEGILALTSPGESTVGCNTAGAGKVKIWEPAGAEVLVYECKRERIDRIVLAVVGQCLLEVGSVRVRSSVRVLT